jgi:hypothetical protein
MEILVSTLVIACGRGKIFLPEPGGVVEKLPQDPFLIACYTRENEIST